MLSFCILVSNSFHLFRYIVYLFKWQLFLYFSELGNDSQRVCSFQDDDCVSKHWLALDKSSCLPECNSIDYNFEVMVERMKPKVNDSLLNIRYSASIYFGSDEFVAYKRFESYGTVGLLSNIGGLLGMFLGLSALSVVETVYFFTLRFFNDLWCKIK